MTKKLEHRLALAALMSCVLGAEGLGYASALAQTQPISGQVLDEKNQPIAGASCTLTGRVLPEEGLSVTTDERGQFEFPGLVPGRYELLCAAMGHEPVAQKDLEVTADQGPVLQVVLPERIGRLRTEIEVRAEPGTVAQQSATQPASLGSLQLKELSLVEQKFKAALPLVPGVVRTPDGKISIKGSEEAQGLLLVDSAESVDPVTGSFAIDVPIDAIESLSVYKSAYRPEYGRFSGGLTSIETKPPSSDRWHYELNDLLPTPRIKSGHIVGIADDSPRFTFTGPILANRFNFSESVVYDLVKQPVRGLPWPNNETKTEEFNSFTSFQYIFSPQHLLTVNVNAFPLKREFADINSLVPQSASSNYGQRGFSVGATDRYLFSSGASLSTLVQNTEFDSNGYGQGPQDMLITPNGWGGNFFNTYTRDSSQQEIREAYELPSEEWHGKHTVKVGAEVVRRAYHGTSHSDPVLLLRPDGSTAERIDFRGSGSLAVEDTEVAVFAQDHWAFNEQFLLDAGLRYSSQTVGEPAAVAPRLGLVYSPHGDGKTIFRGGVGIFYDRLPLLAGDFTQNPTRTLSFFDAKGILLAPPVLLQNAYVKVNESGSRVIPSNHRLDSTPYNLTWNFEADRELRPHVVVRVSYLASRTHNEFTVGPQCLPANIAFTGLQCPAGSDPVLLLSNTGGSHYHEVESTLRLRANENTDVNFSYVHSRARGDFNTLEQLYAPFEQPVIRPNQFADLPSNIPNRVITWGRFKMPWQITASPLFDVHSGFPYSKVDTLQNYVGIPNRSRFPAFLSLDLKLSKDFHLPFPWIKRYKFRGAFGVYNLTNHSNPRDVFSNIMSPFFGHFAGFQHRSYDTWFDILY